MEFNFGPISRTETGGRKDSFNLTSLPLHEVMDALMASVDRDEFVAWLWHDLFKPLFYLQKSQKTKYKWIHTPGKGVFKQHEIPFANAVKIPTGMIRTHHGGKIKSGEQKFSLREGPIIEDQFDQTGLGRESRFLQLAFVVEPAANTALLRAVIADTFVETVTKTVADAIHRQLYSNRPVFNRVRYVFEFSLVKLPSQPTTVDIQALADQYEIDVSNEELIIKHLIPTNTLDFDGQKVEVIVDFTSIPPTPERFEAGLFSLVELLTVYQDSRTILMSIPQFLSVDVQQIQQQVRNRTAQRLQELNVRITASEKKLKKQIWTKRRQDWSKLPLISLGQEVDLLAHIFAEQVEIRMIDKADLHKQVKVQNRKYPLAFRFLGDVINWPIEQLLAKSRHCRLCGSAFESALPDGEMAIRNGGSVSPDFTDFEHIGFSGDICPMCRVYAMNSHQFTQVERNQGSTGMRKAYRGAFALVMPASHFTYAEDQCKLVEKPPLDIGGRFANPLQRATVTLQEYALFNMLSRRIIDRIWTQLDDTDETQPLPLPYLGAILLTQDKFAQVKALFDSLEMLFEEVVLSAYPFKVTVQPAVELAFEMAVNDLQKHHTKHTYLKTSPITVSVGPESEFTLLVDNNLQLEVNRKFFADRDRLFELLDNIKGQKRQYNWLLSVLQGNDPVTATAETFYDRASFYKAEEAFWSTHIEEGPPAKQWSTYEEMRKEVEQIVSRYPLLIEFFRR